MAVDSNGEVYSNLTESAKAAIKAGIKVGDTAPDYTEKTSGTKQTVTLSVDTQVTWKYI